MSKKENKSKNESNSENIKDDAQLTIDDVNKIEDLEDKIEETEIINENSDADYIHDESIVSDDEFKKKLKEEKYKEKLKNKELYKQYRKDKKERKKANKEAIKKIEDKQARREFKIEKREEELNIRTDLGIKTKGERFSIFMKRTVMRGRLQTFLLILILISAYITINLYTQNGNLPKFDVTAHKVYTLSEDTKEYVSGIEDDVRIYVYGFPEEDYVCDLAKQYAHASEHITYQYIDTNSKDIVNKYNLLNQTRVVIVETDITSKQLFENDFSTYDTITGDAIDLTENAITNAIYSCLSKNQPHIYYLEGHGASGESTSTVYQSANALLANNGFKISSVDLLRTGKIPEDCNLIIIPAIYSDLFENEAQLIRDYIQKGGNILLMTEYSDTKTVSNLKNLKSIVDMYDSMIDNNGFIIEQDMSNQTIFGQAILIPTLNTEHVVTKSLHDSDSISDRSNNAFVGFYYPNKLILPSEESQAKNKLQVDILASTSENSIFIKENKQTVGSYPIAAMITKTIKESEDGADAIKSSIIMIGDTNFCSDRTMTIQNTSVPLSAIGKNVVFFTNAVAGLTEKEDFINLRKPIYTATFTPTNGQNLVVGAIIIAFPILIILIGIIVKTIRKRRN